MTLATRKDNVECTPCDAYSSSTHSYTRSTPSRPVLTLAVAHWISTPTACSSLSQSAWPSNANASASGRARISDSSEGRPEDDSGSAPPTGDEDDEEMPSADKSDATSPLDDDEPAGIASSPSSLAPALRGAELPEEVPPPPEAASRRRSSSRSRDCLARSIERDGDLVFAAGDEAVEPPAEEDEERSDLVSRMRRGGSGRDRRLETRARSERTTWKCLQFERFRQLPFYLFLPANEANRPNETRSEHSLSRIPHILARQTRHAINRKDEPVCCREVLRERAGAEARVAWEVDDVQRGREGDGGGLYDVASPKSAMFLIRTDS